MSADHTELSVVAVSLQRPLAGAIARGPCRVVNVPQLVGRAGSALLPAEGLLVVIHANAGWAAADLEAVRSLWPECPPDPKHHGEGLVAVGLLERIEWIPANGAAAEDPWATGPWALVLRDVVAFKTPVQCLGYPGLFGLPAPLEGRIRTAWLERPLENGRRPLRALECPACAAREFFDLIQHPEAPPRPTVSGGRSAGCLVTGTTQFGGEVPEFPFPWEPLPGGPADAVGICLVCRTRVRHAGDHAEAIVDANASEWRHLTALEAWLEDSGLFYRWPEPASPPPTPPPPAAGGDGDAAP